MYEPPREENIKMTGGGESPSAYASAESSPLQSLQSFSSLKQAEEMSAAAAGGAGQVKGGLVNSSSAVGIATLGKVEYDQANGLLNEYQSLPPNLTSNETVKDIIEKTVKSSIEEISANNNKKSPKTSPETTTQRSSMLSLLGRMFQKSDSSKKKDATATTTLPSVSSSSPNPENSPYKLLAAKQPQHEHLEKLAALNHKEHEKVDPILSSASIKLVDNETSKLSSQQATCSTSGADVVSAMSEPSAPSTKCMPVPASSHEFCMDLNLNLAAAASADLDHKTQSNTSPQQQCDHNRFTKNASTSSIHNDLKLILEEGKEKSPTTAATAKSTTAVEQKNKDEGKTEPKPQRDRSHKSSSNKQSRHSKHSSKNANQQSPLSKMLTEIDTEKRRSGGDLKQQSPMPNRHRYSKELLNRINNERATLISTIFPEIFKTYSCCMTGKHWDPEKYFDIVQYTNDRNQPMKPYKNRTPRMNTHHNNNNNNNNNGGNNNYYKKPNYNNQYHNNSNSFSRQNRSYNQNRGGSESTNNVDVDRMLLNMVKSKQAMPTPTVNLMDILNKKHTTNIIGDLFASAAASLPIQHDVPATNAPKHYPRILTAQELEFSQLCTGAGLMQQLQKSSKTPDRSGGLHSLSQRMNNSLESCGSPSGSSTSSSSRNSMHNHNNNHNHHHHHQPQHHHHNHNHHVNTDLDNSSDAYKQLVKNLSNHPLSAASQPNKCSDIDQLLLKLNDSNKQRTSTTMINSENPTQHLKKLLHLDSHQSKPANKPRHHNHHHHHHHQRKPKQTQEYNVSETLAKSAMEELMLKLNKQKNPSPVNQNTEQEHFNGLINKLIPSLVNHIPSTGQRHSPTSQASAMTNNDILKWFKEPNAV